VRTAREFRPDAVVLDIMLPDFGGMEVLRRVRAELPHVCVLFLTARDAVEDRVAGITAGGDDYVTKPFSLEEVLARLRGLLRRAGITRSRSDTELAIGDLTMDEEARELRRAGARPTSALAWPADVAGTADRRPAGAARRRLRRRRHRHLRVVARLPAEPARPAARTGQPPVSGMPRRPAASRRRGQPPRGPDARHSLRQRPPPANT